MIFKNKLMKLPDGENLSLYPISESEMDLYIGGGKVKKKRLKLDNIFRCESLPIDINADFVSRISGEHVCVCLNGNMSVKNNEEI